MMFKWSDSLYLFRRAEFHCYDILNGPIMMKLRTSHRHNEARAMSSPLIFLANPFEKETRTTKVPLDKNHFLSILQKSTDSDVEPVQLIVSKNQGSHQWPTTAHQSPDTSHQSPITAHQSPVTSHQSPPRHIWLVPWGGHNGLVQMASTLDATITDHQSPLTNHQSPLTNHPQTYLVSTLG